MRSRWGSMSWMPCRVRLVVLLLTLPIIAVVCCPTGGDRCDRCGGQLAGEGVAQRWQLPGNDLLAILGSVRTRTGIILAVHREGITQRGDVLIGHGGAT
jgi:hypothetical protein